MKRIAIAFVLITFVAGSATAGVKWTLPVWIDATTRHAQGSIADTRQGPKDMWIGCSVSANAGSLPLVQCGAQLTYEDFVWCWSQDPALVSVAQAAPDDAFLAFEWNEGHECTFIWESNNSANEPKAP